MTKVEVRVDGKTIDTQLSNEVEILPENEGVLTVQVVAQDAVGNETITSVVVVVVQGLGKPFEVEISRNENNPFEFTVVTEGDASLEGVSILLSAMMR